MLVRRDLLETGLMLTKRSALIASHHIDTLIKKTPPFRHCNIPHQRDMLLQQSNKTGAKCKRCAMIQPQCIDCSSNAYKHVPPTQLFPSHPTHARPTTLQILTSPLRRSPSRKLSILTFLPSRPCSHARTLRFVPSQSTTIPTCSGLPTSMAYFECMVPCFP